MSGVNGHGSQTGSFGAAGNTGAPETDPSMEDILASIRRILSEDETLTDTPSPGTDEVFNLDESMLVAAPRRAAAMHAQAASAVAEPGPEAAGRQATKLPDISHLAEPALIPEAPMTAGNGVSRAPNELNGQAALAHGPVSAPMEPLVTPEATDAVTASMSSLMRSLASERQVSLYRGGPTLEDMVRDEMRPMLKEWLDTNLPPLVERIVRAEIERVSQRAAG